MATDYAKFANERRRRDFLSATPERAAKTAEPYTVIATNDERGATLETQRLVDAPLLRLYGAGMLGSLARDDSRGTAVQRRDAGEKLYAHWYYGRMFPLGSRDYRKPYSAAGDGFAIMPQTERQAFHRIRWREADECLGSDRTAVVTRAIVIEEREPLDVGMIVSNRKDRAQARAVAIEWLIDGLDRLRNLWGMKESAR
jgi:hypothetical protein